MSARKKIKQRWFVPAGLEPTEMDQKIMEWQEKGKIVPTRDSETCTIFSIFLPLRLKFPQVQRKILWILYSV